MKASTIEFLKKLAKNNNRDWFNEHKGLYIEAQEDVLHLVENLISEIGAYDEEILKIDAKKALFRIYRDSRFSKDKSPYKTNFGASLGIGKGNKIAGYYLHIEPEKSFLAGGVYMPEASVLKEIRQEISSNGKEFLTILEQDDFRQNFRGLSVENKLKKAPRGFEKDDPMVEFLKLKHFVVSHPLADDELLHTNAAAHFAHILRPVKALNDFLEAPFK